jgi:hypothetical protein
VRPGISHDGGCGGGAHVRVAVLRCVVAGADGVGKLR